MTRSGPVLCNRVDFVQGSWSRFSQSKTKDFDSEFRIPIKDQGFWCRIQNSGSQSRILDPDPWSQAVTRHDLCGATQLISAGISNWQQDESQFLKTPLFSLSKTVPNFPPKMLRFLRMNPADVIMRVSSAQWVEAVVLVARPRLVTAWAGECRYRREPKLSRLQQVQQMWLFILFCRQPEGPH